MKFLKKTAALLFCVALALSVMAVSAMAEGEVYTVKLTQNETDKHQNVDTTNDDNGTLIVEYNQSDDVYYDIVLTTEASDKSISAVDFKLTVTDGLAVSSVTNLASNAIETASTGGVYRLNVTTGGTANTGANATGKTVDSTGLKVATVKYHVGDSVAHDTRLNFSVTDVVIHEVGSTDETTATATNATASIIVDPQYTVSVYNPAVNETTGVIDAKQTKTGSAVYSFTYTLFDGSTVNGNDSNNITATFGTGTDAKSIANFPGYKFANSFAVDSGHDSSALAAWTAGETVAANKTISDLNVASSGGSTPDAVRENKWGNVDLVAQYETVTYTVTYKLEDTPAANATVVNAAPTASFTAHTTTTDAKLTYTIESAVTTVADNLTNFGTATRDAYKFLGWTVGAPAKANDDYSEISFDNSFWSTFGDGKANAGKYQAPGKTAPTANKAYGDVTLTANWVLVGEYATVNYKYAKTDEVLVLFAVPKNSSDTSILVGTYQYNENPMYVLNGAGSTQTYAKYFGKDVDDQDKVTDASHTIYGYLAAVPAQTSITFLATYDADNPANRKSNNVTIDYGGDVNKNTSVNAGDYGIVIDLLAGLGTQSYDTSLDVESRLRAHIASNAVVEATDNETHKTTYTLGTIADVAAIMDKVGVAPASGDGD